MPLTTRLNALEAQIKGVPASYDGETTTTAQTRQPITRRVAALDERLERIGQESDALKRLMEGCEPNLRLI